MNRSTHTFLILGGLGILALITGFLLFGATTAIILLVFGGFIALAVPGTSAQAQLRGVQPLRYHQAPELYDMVAALARSAGLSRSPGLYLAQNGVLNAATVGSAQSASIIVTTGLLRRLSTREIYAVLAHELSHIANEDLTLFRFAEALRQAVNLFVRVGWLLVIFALPVVLATGTFTGSAILALLGAPIAATLLQAALLRTREFEADRTAAELTGDPEGLAQALSRIEYVQENTLRMMLPVSRQSHPLFRTHPPTRERVRRLLAAAGAQRRGFTRHPVLG